MRPKDRTRAAEITARLRDFETAVRPLPGIASPACRVALVEQVMESIHRVQYPVLLRERDISPRRADPSSEMFDPLKAAILADRADDRDEACWLVFLSVHFGKHRQDGWILARDVYGALGHGAPWTWRRTRDDPGAFERWAAANEGTLRGADGVTRRFGNHRKYETLRAASSRGVGAVIASYVEWVGARRSHRGLIDAAIAQGEREGRPAFDVLYVSMANVVAFGRTARFDYLTMLQKLQLAEIVPRSPYLVGATGPLAGARLLFGGGRGAVLRAGELERDVLALGDTLGIGMQEMEDSLCNWQKSPETFVPFRG